MCSARPRPREFPLFTATNFLAAASDNAFHPPSLTDFFPPVIFGEGTIFEFNRLSLIRVIAAVLLLTILWIVAKRATLVPTRGQSVLEFILEFVRNSIGKEVLGDHAAKFVPMLTTLFLTIVAFNITGIIPGLNLAGTSLIAVPLLLALWVYVVYLAVGIKEQGFGSYLRNNLFPPSVPWYLYPLITPIEILQVFLFRPASLAIRLTANMVAGHILLVLSFSATNFFFFHASVAMKAMSVVTITAGLAFTLFEILVALLQAYVFTLLAAVYINMSLEAEH